MPRDVEILVIPAKAGFQFMSIHGVWIPAIPAGMTKYAENHVIPAKKVYSPLARNPGMIIH
jgi:hypothetical protein